MSRLQRAPEKTTEVHEELEELEDYSPQHPVLAYEPKMNLVRAPDHLQQYVEVNPFEHQFQPAEPKKKTIYFMTWGDFNKIGGHKNLGGLGQYGRLQLHVYKNSETEERCVNVYFDKAQFALLPVEPPLWTNVDGKFTHKKIKQGRREVELRVSKDISCHAHLIVQIKKEEIWKNLMEAAGLKVKLWKYTSMSVLSSPLADLDLKINLQTKK